MWADADSWDGMGLRRLRGVGGKGLVYKSTQGKWEGYRHVYNHTYCACTSSHQRVCSVRFASLSPLTDGSTVGLRRAACSERGGGGRSERRRSGSHNAYHDGGDGE